MIDESKLLTRLDRLLDITTFVSVWSRLGET
jgi:hypothetical protein